jgi:HAD superfamily hydrolase (TIGR01509 family)
MIKALIFDFDGLILDTEVPEYQSWVELYQSYGCDLPLEKWVECIGTTDAFNPYEYLEQQLGQPVDRSEVRLQRRARFAELMTDQTILPGVQDTITTAKQLGLKLGVASSSPREWVVGHLSRFGLTTYFDAIRCGDEVAATKPDPTLYLEALKALEIEAHEAIALEDSPNGILAAKRAGIFCIAIPNALTRELSLSHADFQMDSLADLPLEQILQRAGDLPGCVSTGSTSQETTQNMQDAIVCPGD